MRKSVEKHAERMEERLQEHEDKGGWEESTFRFLISEMRLHLEDLNEALFEQGIFGSVENECADISNFAMMIADNFSRLPKKN